MLAFMLNPMFLLMAIIILHQFFQPERFQFTTPQPKVVDTVYGTPTNTIENRPMRSKGEAKIGSWLEAHDLQYTYEAKINGLTPDFLVTSTNPATIIEYWGLADLKNPTGDQYRRDMEKKMRIYKTLNYSFIGIYPNQLGKLDTLLNPLTIHA